MKVREILEKTRKLLRNGEYRAGLYLTLAFHLVLIIVLLACSIRTLVRPESSFVLDFSGVEEQEEILRREKMRESVQEEVNALLSGQTQSIRNVVTDAGRRDGENLRDDRQAQDVYDQARRLQEKLDASRRAAERASDPEDGVSLANEKEQANAPEYTGPSVISYRLDGRKAMNLPVPAYKCIGAGDVTVAVVVNRKGHVVTARINETVSSPDNCLREYALKAARRSRFTASSAAEERQAGEIVYRFVAQ